MAVEKERNDVGSSNGILQSQVDSLSREIESEREEWSRRRAELQGKILQYLSDQEKILSVEKESRETMQAHMQEQLDAVKATLERSVQDLRAQLADERRLQTTD